MRIFIEPTEPLLFRTGRPFDAGENNFAESIFPPTPETMQGAIRAMIAANTTLVNSTMSIAARLGTDTLTKLIGNQNGYGRFHITGLALGKRIEGNGLVERLFPAPASLMKVRFKGEKDTDDFPSIETESDFYTLEPRLGIGMQNDTKTTQTGYLYQIQMIRMEAGYGFVVDIRLSEESNPGKSIDDSKTQKDLGLPDEGWLTLGGEQRAAHFTVLGITPQEGSIEAQQPGQRVYLATPAYFIKGWQPPPKSFTPEYKLIAAAINNPVSIGGWQLNPNNAGGSSKTTRRCVPAGSIYFFDKPLTVRQPLTEYGWQIGYGIAYTGGYQG